MKKYLLLFMFVFSTLAVVSCGKDDDHDDHDHDDHDDHDHIAYVVKG